MTGKTIILSLLILFTIVPGCTAAMSKTGKKIPVNDSAAGTLPEIKNDCTTCHNSSDVRKGSGQLKKPLAALCLDCHPDRIASREHRVDIVPTMQVKELPLFDGKMTCVTCHDPHRNTYGSMLRIDKRYICIQCHPY